MTTHAYTRTLKYAYTHTQAHAHSFQTHLTIHLAQHTKIHAYTRSRRILTHTYRYGQTGTRTHAHRHTCIQQIHQHRMNIIKFNQQKTNAQNEFIMKTYRIEKKISKFIASKIKLQFQLLLKMQNEVIRKISVFSFTMAQIHE